MSPRDIEGQIDKLHRESAALAARRGPLQEELSKALTVEGRFFNQRDVDDARAVLARIDRDVANLTERIAALSGQLPSPEARASMESNAKAMRDTAIAASGELPRLWAAFIATLEIAERAARELARTRAMADGAVGNLRELVRDNSLQVAVPARPAPDTNDFELARHLVMLLGDVAGGEAPDATCEKYLDLIRGRITAAALAPA